MRCKTVERPLPDSYFALVKRFPLTHIRDDRHLAAALEVIDRLLPAAPDEGAEAYLDALSDLVAVYEDGQGSIPDAPEADVLRELMRANGLSQQALAKRVGIAQSTLSAVLNGARSLTKAQVVALARFFRVAPGAFLPA